jgi:putative intracellular protease/amidase
MNGLVGDLGGLGVALGGGSGGVVVGRGAADEVRERGARYEQGPTNWESFVVRDGRLISGQNPASSGAMADAVLAALGEREPASRATP